MVKIIFLKKDLIRNLFFLCFLILIGYSGPVFANGGGGGGGGGGCGNPGGTCFLPGTLVDKPDGSKKPIEEIEIGEEVLGYDLKTKKLTKNIVGGLISPVVWGWYEIIFNEGNNLKLTDSHPMYIKKNNGEMGWATISPKCSKSTDDNLNLKKIEEGDSIFNQNGDWQKIKEILKHNQYVQTYNLTNVDSSKTFFVEGLLAHNKTCFVAGTKVMMADGTLKNIEDIEVGEKVLGKDNKINKVIGLERPIVGERKTYLINNKIEATGDHPFLTTEGWKVNDLEYKLKILENSDRIDNSENPITKDTISQLEVGDILFTKNGQEKVETIEIKTSRPYEEIVYDLNLNGDNTYYANDYLVHNCGGWDVTDPESGGGTSCTTTQTACSAPACGEPGTHTVTETCTTCAWGGKDDMVWTCYLPVVTTSTVNCMGQPCPTPSCTVSWSPSSLVSPGSATATGTSYNYITAASYSCSGIKSQSGALSAGSSPITFNFSASNSGTQTCVMNVSNPTASASCSASLNVCAPNCSCKTSTCVGSTCSDGCGGNCPGTKVDTSWSPSPSTVCYGDTFTQTGDQCGVTRTAYGTKECIPRGACDQLFYSCSSSAEGHYNGNWIQTGNWWTDQCTSGTNNCDRSPLIYNFSGCYNDINCGTETCKNSCEYEYCASLTEVRLRKIGTRDICSTTSSPYPLGCSTTPNDNCQDTPVKSCETGYICAPTTGTTCGKSNVDCVPKSTTWTET